MDIISIVILSLIVSAFILFGSVLMYGDYVSQQARRTQVDNGARVEPRRATPDKERRAA